MIERKQLSYKKLFWFAQKYIVETNGDVDDLNRLLGFMRYVMANREMLEDSYK